MRMAWRGATLDERRRWGDAKPEYRLWDVWCMNG